MANNPSKYKTPVPKPIKGPLVNRPGSMGRVFILFLCRKCENYVDRIRIADKCRNISNWNPGLGAQFSIPEVCYVLKLSNKFRWERFANRIIRLQFIQKGWKIWLYDSVTKIVKYVERITNIWANFPFTHHYLENGNDGAVLLSTKWCMPF